MSKKTLKMDKSGHLQYHYIIISIHVFALNTLVQNAKAFKFFNIFPWNFKNQRGTKLAKIELQIAENM